MDILTVLEAAHSPLTIDEIKEYSGILYSQDRLDNLIRSGDISQVPGLDNVYWSVPAALKKRSSAQKCQSPVKTDRNSLIKQIIDLRAKITTITKEHDVLMLKKDSFPTQEQLNDHMNRLHKYNDIKDNGMSIIGFLSEIEKVHNKDLYERYGLNLNDDEN